MRLPSPDEYQIAIQDPSSAFDDLELKTCRAETAQFGLPRGIAGDFAVTYHLTDLEKNWAVRCFFRDIPDDLRRRYEAISKFIAKTKSGPFVDAHFLEKGINVGGEWYPIVKMAWVKGLTLNEYIYRSISRPRSCSWLQGALREVADFLEKRGVAHGDLQHGNIMVLNAAGEPDAETTHLATRNLTLVDYDAMFVPDLTGLSSNEIGHHNYQHPNRRAVNYDGTIDRFSFMVILTALRAIDERPYLWRRYSLDRESLLFKKEDFLDPDSSPLFKELLRLPETGSLAMCLMHYCRIGDLQQMPRPADFLQEAPDFKPRISAPIIVTLTGQITEITKRINENAAPSISLTLSDEDGVRTAVTAWPPAADAFDGSAVRYKNQWVRLTLQDRGYGLEFDQQSQFEVVPSVADGSRGIARDRHLETTPTISLNPAQAIPSNDLSGAYGLIFLTTVALAFGAAFVSPLLAIMVCLAGFFLMSIFYITAPKSGTPSPAQPLQSPTTSQVRTCKNGHPMTWIPQVSRWYCYMCQDYD